MNRSDYMFKKIIIEICKELNIKYTILSNDWIIKLVKFNKTKYIIGNKFNLNKYTSGQAMCDKSAFYDILINLNIPTCIHNIIYNDLDKQKLITYFEKNNKIIVIKPNTGASGTDVYKITDKEELLIKAKKLLKKYQSISICPYYNIKYEYRVVVLDNKIKLIYRKENPKVVGDGKTKIKDLLIKFNKYYFKDKTLSNKILKPGEEYVYDWRFNLTRGSIASIDIDDNLKEQLSKIAIKVASKLEIRFASIDIIELYDNKLLVLEANNCVTLSKCLNFIPNGYNIAKEIYKEALIKMFEE